MNTDNRILDYKKLLDDAVKWRDAKAEPDKWLVWISENDKSTCTLCRSKNGQLFTNEKDPWTDFLTRPPLHKNCKCELVPIDKTARNAGTIYRDVTDEVTAAVVAAEPYFLLHTFDLFEFYNQMKFGGPWDIKLKKQWEDKIGTSYPGAYPQKIVFRSEVMTIDKIGNIAYGYLGSAAKFSELLLREAAQFAAGNGLIGSVASLITRGDDPEDQEAISMGVNWYFERHMEDVLKAALETDKKVWQAR
jgi:hypothetical protein